MWLIVLGVGTFINGIDPAWIALIGTLFGGIALKATESWLSKNETRRKSSQEDRRDLTQEVKDLVDRVDKLEQEVTLWRDRYYAEQEKRHLLRLQILEAGLVPADSLTVSLTDKDGKVTDTFDV